MGFAPCNTNAYKVRSFFMFGRLPMLREVALRNALQNARDLRAEQLEETVHRATALRRRLRELTDRHLALGAVHARFVPEQTIESPPPAAEPVTAAEPPQPTAPSPPHPLPEIVRAAPTLAKRPEEGYEKALEALAARFADGFSVGQMREVLDEVQGRTHTYDFAWTLANTLQRARVLDIAGSRQGPAGPIRVFRVAPRPAVAATTPTEAR